MRSFEIFATGGLLYFYVMVLSEVLLAASRGSD